MIYSRFEEFSDSQLITGDAAGTNQYDNLNPGGAIGTEMYLVVQVDVTLDLLTSLTINLVTDTALPIDASSTVLASKSVLAAALLTGETVWIVRVPRDQQRYVGVYYDVVGTNPTAGSVSAFFTNNIDQYSVVE